MGRYDNNSDTKIQPGIALHRQVRAGFIRQGITMSTWCREHHVNRPNLISALRGGWRGPKATVLLRRVCEAAGIGPYDQGISPDDTDS